MVLEEMNAIYNPWSILQEPLHASSGINASFRTLLAAIDQGWQVEEPVQALPIAGMDSWTYFFVMTHPVSAQTCWLYIPVVPDVEQYIARNHFQVIEGSYYSSGFRLEKE